VAYAPETVKEATKAHPTRLLLDHSHAKLVPLGPAQIAHGIDEGMPRGRLTTKPTLTPSDRPIAQKLAQINVGGIRIVNPALTVEAARKAKLPITLAAALLSQESHGGRNEWGHDPTIFTGGYDPLRGKYWGATVTKAGYLAYRAERGPEGKGGQQGVGPTQLTYYGFQDIADKMGGAWKPLPNMIEGFTVLRQNVQSQGLRLGIALYNGQLSPTTLAYADEVLKLEREWAAKLGVPSIQG
jgi:hypothetical protein